MKKTTNRKDKGTQIVLSTLILTGAILTITILAMSFSNMLLNWKFDINEYDQAQSMFLTLSRIIDDVTASPFTAHYVHYNMRVSELTFDSGKSTIEVGVSGLSYPIIKGTTGIVQVKGGPNVGTVETNIQGNDLSIITDPSESLGRIYKHQDNGAWITLDYMRVRVTYLGCSPFYDIKGYPGKCYFNVVRIAFVNLTISSTTGSNSLDIIVRSVPSYQFFPPYPVNDIVVNVITANGATNLTVHGLYMEGSQQVMGTILQVVNTKVVVSSK